MSKLKTNTISLYGLLLFALPMSGNATLLTNLADYGSFTGEYLYMYSETLRNDAQTDRLSYVGSTGETQASLPEFNPLFSWTAGVNEWGEVTDPGSMLWLGDFGHGYELLASGKLEKVGTYSSNLFYDDIYFFSNLQFLFDIDFLDARVSGMGDHLLFVYEYQFDAPLPGPFSYDFECDSGGNSGNNTYPSCMQYSTSQLHGVKVPEPSSLPLLAIALLVFFVAPYSKGRIRHRNG